jgi:hypothetical protein
VPRSEEVIIIVWHACIVFAKLTCMFKKKSYKVLTNEGTGLVVLENKTFSVHFMNL